MDDTHKTEFFEMLAGLAGAHDRTLTTQRIDGYWKSMQPMSIELVRRVVDECYVKLRSAERGDVKFPTASALWDLSRELRRLPDGKSTASEPTQSPWMGDQWTAAAQLLLLRHVAQNASQSKLDYAPDTTGFGAVINPGPRTKAIAAILQGAALDWAYRMRNDRASGGTRDGKPLWLELISAADTKVRDYLNLTTQGVPF